MRIVAALYIDRLGPYPKLAGVDSWDIKRNAKLYEGPHPVVAHPDCGPWSTLRRMCTKQDRECGPRAIDQARRYGGIVEQPANSALFEYCGVTVNQLFEVHQVSWGHACSKPTWLYAPGIDPVMLVAGIRYGGTPTHCVCRGPGQIKRLPVAHAGLKRRTPQSFAEWLVSLARTAVTP